MTNISLNRLKPQIRKIKNLIKGSVKMAQGNPQKNFGQENVKPGDNSKYLTHAMTIAKWDKIDIESDEEVTKRLDDYFALCVMNDIKPTVTGMANALKINKKTLYDWRNGITRNQTDSRKQIINIYYGMLEELYEDYMMNGKVNPVSGIFMGKNHFGYEDKKEISVQPKSNFDESINPDDVRDKYIESAVDDECLIESTAEEVEERGEN